LLLLATKGFAFRYALGSPAAYIFGDVGVESA
jgi:hypothetical protein